MGTISESAKKIKSGIDTISNLNQSVKKRPFQNIHEPELTEKQQEIRRRFMESAKNNFKTVQDLARRGAEKTSSLFAKLKESYYNHTNVPLSEPEKESLELFRDSLQDSIGRIQNSQIKINMEESVDRLNDLLEQETIRTKDVEKAMRPISKRFINMDMENILNGEIEDYDEMKLSKKEIRELAKRIDQYDSKAEFYENMSEADRQILGLSNKKVDELTNTYRGVSNRLTELIDGYCQGQDILLMDVQEAEEPITKYLDEDSFRESDKNRKPIKLVKEEIDSLRSESNAYAIIADTLENMSPEERKALGGDERINEIISAHRAVSNNLNKLINDFDNGRDILPEEVDKAEEQVTKLLENQKSDIEKNILNKVAEKNTPQGQSEDKTERTTNRKIADIDKQIQQAAEQQEKEARDQKKQKNPTIDKPLDR